MAAQGRPGRPKAKDTRGKKSTIGVRVAHALKRRLNEESDRNDRPLSQEAELALEAYYDGRRGQIDVLDLLYGREATKLLLLIGEIAIDLQREVATEALGGRTLSDPWVYGKFRDAVIEALDHQTPTGPAVDPDWRGTAAAAHGEDFARDRLNELGRDVARAVCRSIFEAKIRSERAEAIRERSRRRELPQ
jgi:hypothetical protein